MPVAKKGQNKSSGVAEALKSVLPNDIKKNFTLTPKAEKGQKQKSGGGMVETYTRSIEDHMLRHYEMFTLTMTRGLPNTRLNLMDIIYYHTYGDYRMVYEDGKIVFKYRTLDNDKLGVKPHSKSRPIAELLSRDEKDGVNYVYAPGTVPTYEVQDIAWMNDELNKGSAGMRLMLPSIGTLMMTTYGYANINQELKKLLQNVLIKLNNVLREIKEDSDVLSYLVTAIGSDPRWDAVKATVEKSKTLNEIRQEALDKEADSSWDEAIKHFVTEVVESTTSRYIETEEVKISPKAGLSSDEQDILADIVGESNAFLEEVFKVSKLEKPDKTYLYTIRYGTEEVPFTFKQSQLLPTGQPKRFIEKKKKSFVAIPSPQNIVFYSMLVDQMFALQAYLFTIKAKDKMNFGYLSPTLVPKKKSEVIARFYPNMYSPNLDSPPDKKNYLKGKPNERQSLLFQLLQHRNIYTQMILRTQRSLATDTRVFDLFYNEDLTLKEIKWLAYALSDEAKVLVKKPEKRDPLAQLVYFRTGAEEDIELTGQADRRTVFYKVDIPMLKEVMLEYVRVFNQFTITAAFSIESSDATPKEGQIAKALWTSIRKRSSKLLENNEAIPHEFFNNLFEEVRKTTGETNLSFDLYPPNWSDTNILTLLTVDPSQLNTLLDTEEYQKYLDEYIDYIYTRYGNRANVAAAITTSLESYRIKAAMNYEEIRKDFIEMLTEHEKKRQIKATNYVFRAYSAVIAIMRGQLAIPLSYREEAIAEGYELEALRSQLRGRAYGERGIAAVPPEHPMAALLAKRREKKEEPEEEEEEEEEEEPVEAVTIEELNDMLSTLGGTLP